MTKELIEKSCEDARSFFATASKEELNQFLENVDHAFDAIIEKGGDAL